MSRNEFDYSAAFRVEKKFHLRDRIAQPGKSITLDDPFLARDLIELRRISCDEETAAAVQAACEQAAARYVDGDPNPAPAIYRRRPDVHLVPSLGVARRR